VPSAYVKLACGHNISRDAMAAVSVLGDRLHATVDCPHGCGWQPIPKPKKTKHMTSDEPMF
jgi:hypothetical protein